MYWISLLLVQITYNLSVSVSFSIQCNLIYDYDKTIRIMLLSLTICLLVFSNIIAKLSPHSCDSCKRMWLAYLQQAAKVKMLK